MKTLVAVLLVLVASVAHAWGDREQGILTGIVVGQVLAPPRVEVVRVYVRPREYVEPRVYIEPRIYVEPVTRYEFRRPGPEIFYDRPYHHYHYHPEYREHREHREYDRGYRR